MKVAKKWLLFMIILAVCLTGCSGLRVDVAPEVRLADYHTVYLSSPPDVAQHLEAVVVSELEGLGYRVEQKDLPDTLGATDLVGCFSFITALDMNADGDLTKRVTQFHLQFIDSASYDIVGVADYFYGSGDDDLEKGVRKAIAGLKTSMEAPPAPVALPVEVTQEEEKNVNVSRPASVEPQVPSKLQASDESAEVQEAVSARPADKTVSEEAPAKELPPVRRVVPKTGTDNPWVPRFESWGFENWGKESPDEE